MESLKISAGDINIDIQKKMQVSGFAPNEWLSTINHIKTWVTNLLRAEPARKIQSFDALRSVIKAVRATTIYLGILRQGRPRSIARETKLSRLWTELSSNTEELGMKKLSRRCRIMGKYWTCQADFSGEFFKNTDMSLLSEIEKRAYVSLKEISQRQYMTP